MRFQALVVAIGLLSVSSTLSASSPWLINARETDAASFPSVVWIESSTGLCTATIVGPQAIITASHCATNGDTVTFDHKGKTYTAKITQSDLYEDDDHDVAMGLVSKVIPDAEPTSVAGKAKIGKNVVMAGFGCTQAVTGEGGNDGTLRTGPSLIRHFDHYEMVLKMEDGVAGCFGDSGGPVFMESAQGRTIIGVNSKANISDTTYSTRLDAAVSLKFIKKFASDNKIDVCGVTKACN